MNENILRTEAMLDVFSDIFGMESTNQTAKILRGRDIHSYDDFLERMCGRVVFLAEYHRKTFSEDREHGNNGSDTRGN